MSPRIAIVALTASSGPEDLAAMLEAGMDDLVVKPIGAGALERALDRWLPEPGRRTTVIPATDGLADAGVADARVDPAAFGRLAAIGDVELADRLVGVFLSDADGRAAQVEEAVRAHDAAAARRALAAIGRIGVLVGAGALCERVRELDDELGRRAAPDDPRWDDADRPDRPGPARRGDPRAIARRRGDPGLAALSLAVRGRGGRPRPAAGTSSRARRPRRSRARR